MLHDEDAKVWAFILVGHAKAYIIKKTNKQKPKQPLLHLKKIQVSDISKSALTLYQINILFISI